MSIKVFVTEDDASVAVDIWDEVVYLHHVLICNARGGFTSQEHVGDIFCLLFAEPAQVCLHTAEGILHGLQLVGSCQHFHFDVGTSDVSGVSCCRSRYVGCVYIEEWIQKSYGDLA